MERKTYMDEATNTSMTMHSGDVMTSVIPSVTSGSTMTGIQITPLTSMAQKRADNMTSRMTTTNMITANNAVGDYFMVFDILHTPPINPLVPVSGTGVTQDMKNYGMTIAAMSQYAHSIGMPVSSGIITAMMDDASDGIMDGMMGGNPISMTGMGGMGGGMMSSMTSTAGTVGLANAMTTFITGTVNKSGLDTLAMQTLISKLTNSGGTIQ